jgi:hypothetical protein
MSEMRKALMWLSGAAATTIACASALSAHAAVGIAQAAGLTGGDYDTHAHGMVPVVVIATMLAAVTGACAYLRHLLRGGRRSLPWLARAFAAKLNWRLFALATTGGALSLAAMELAEQLLAGHLDGPLSAFGDAPFFAFACICACAAALIFGLRRLCAWLAAAHVRIVNAAFALLDVHRAESPPVLVRRERAARFLERNRVATRQRGRRAPPFHLATLHALYVSRGLSQCTNHRGAPARAVFSSIHELPG